MTHDNWPRHADGRQKKIGEMMFEEADRVTREICSRLAPEFKRIGVNVHYAGAEADKPVSRRALEALTRRGR